MDQENIYRTFRKPLLRKITFPITKEQAEMYDNDELLRYKAMFQKAGTPINKVSIQNLKILEQNQQSRTWSACSFNLPSAQKTSNMAGINAFFSSDINVGGLYGLAYLKDVHVLMPHGIIWSEIENEFYSEPALHSIFNTSGYFFQSYLTDWKIIKSSKASVPDYEIDEIYWGYEPQYTNIFHLFLDNIYKYYFYDKHKSFIDNKAKNIPFYSGPIISGTLLEGVLKKIGIVDRFINLDHGIYKVKKLLYPFCNLSLEPECQIFERYLGYRHRSFYREYFDWLKNRMVDQTNKKSTPKRICLLREDAGHRNISNIQEVKLLLQRYGYVPINPGNLAITEQAKIFSSATHIVGVHGAALLNLIWCNSNLKFIEILPKNHQDPGYRGICGEIGIKHHILYAAEADTHSNRSISPPYQDIVVDCKVLEEIICSI